MNAGISFAFKGLDLWVHPFSLLRYSSTNNRHPVMHYVDTDVHVHILYLTDMEL